MTKPFQLLDLFSGIGGFSLGLERSGGFKTVAFCEIEPFCRRVLAKHWPEVPCYDDIRLLTAERLAADGIAVDAICGGFPCQDISHAGRGAGLDGDRSGLWFEYARLICELGPRYVIVENVAALLVRGLERVLGSLAEIGYDAEWHCIPASAVGAPHIRDRIWIVAYPQHPNANIPRSHRASEHQFGDVELRDKQISVPGPLCEDVADAELSESGERCDIDRERRWSGPAQQVGMGGSMADTNEIRLERTKLLRRHIGECKRSGYDGWWATEPDVGRVANGVPNRVDRLSALGNAVVPQIPELIGRAILAAEALR
jgi:DNA (cytosine-5)-methyltransferase 1